ncbi:MAG: hypothetical protein AVDCRST_MAG91-2134 [uncultured Sphingomonadaceae bacterium]|uniref:Uncharacterized protein n=1 Tax=uncultured Sphingomonadaceae bacterium TaxID=169976 RepID=A0A6J4TCA9_9SPHN|nr:MAG: hypothetical protein AVDCRST_MAG91-2134 [uncultured Sphingomonadaceae bacterium]
MFHRDEPPGPSRILQAGEAEVVLRHQHLPLEHRRLEHRRQTLRQPDRVVLPQRGPVGGVQGVGELVRQHLPHLLGDQQLRLVVVEPAHAGDADDLRVVGRRRHHDGHVLVGLVVEELRPLALGLRLKAAFHGGQGFDVDVGGEDQLVGLVHLVQVAVAELPAEGREHPLGRPALVHRLVGQKLPVARERAQGGQVRIADEVGEIGPAGVGGLFQVGDRRVGPALERVEAGEVVEVDDAARVEGDGLQEQPLGRVELLLVHQLDRAAGQLLDALGIGGRQRARLGSRGARCGRRTRSRRGRRRSGDHRGASDEEYDQPTERVGDEGVLRHRGSYAGTD